MADTENIRFTLWKLLSMSVVHCVPKTQEQRGRHLSTTGFPPEETVEQSLLSQRVRQGFRWAGTGCGSWKRTPFLADPWVGAVAEDGEGGGSRAHRTGQRVGRRKARGRAAKMGSLEKAGFNLFTDTTSVLEPSWRRKNLSWIYRTR